MMEQVLGITAIAIIGIWAIAMIVTQILYLIASFRASVGLTLLGMIIPFVGLYVLIKFWEELKKPFLNQVVVAFGGFALIFLGGMGLNAMGIATGLPTRGLPKTADATPPERPPAILELKTIQPHPTVNIPEPATSATPAESPAVPPTSPTAPAQPWGVEVPVRDVALITVPRGWHVIPWKLPNLAVAMGDTERGEYVTVQILDKDVAQPFEVFQKATLQDALQHMIEGTPPTESREQTISDCKVVTYAMGGRSRLPDQTGRPMSARLSCIDGVIRRYYIVQWRTSAWDAQSIQNFDRLLASFAEIGGE